MRLHPRAEVTFSDSRVPIVEIVCAEHLQRTLLLCDEATSFQRIVCQAVTARRGQWGFEQYRSLANVERNSNDLLLRGAMACDTEDDHVWMSDVYRVLQRREEFMRNEGPLLRMIERSSKGIRRCNEALYPFSEAITSDNAYTRH